MIEKLFTNPPKVLPVGFLPNLHLETYQVTDYSDIGALHQMDIDHYDAARVEANKTPDDHMTDWYTTQFFMDAIDRGDNIVILRDITTKEWAGEIWGEIQDNGKLLHIHNIVTAVLCRGKRLCTWMLLEQMRYAESKGIPKIGFDVDPLNKVGMNAYFGMGFVIDGYKPGPDQEWDLNNWVEMHRPIGNRVLELHDEDIIEVLSGDEEGLERAIEEGRIGYELTPDPDGDFYKGIIKFARPVNYDDLWDTV